MNQNAKVHFHISWFDWVSNIIGITSISGLILCKILHTYLICLFKVWISKLHNNTHKKWINLSSAISIKFKIKLNKFFQSCLLTNVCWRLFCRIIKGNSEFIIGDFVCLNINLVTLWVSHRRCFLEGCINIIYTWTNCGGSYGGALDHRGGKDDTNVDIS